MRSWKVHKLIKRNEAWACPKSGQALSPARGIWMIFLGIDDLSRFFE